MSDIFDFFSQGVPETEAEEADRRARYEHHEACELKAERDSLKVEVERCGAALTAYDDRMAKCPFTKPTFSADKCPNCGSTARQGCGVDASASYAFINAVRAALSKVPS